jgi:multidrug efflux pump subunit AcrA (membrane-fusion protein)
MPSSLRVAIAVVLIAISGDLLSAQRERTRPGPRRSTTVDEAQKSELTLTLTDVAVRPLQVWVRTAGAIDDSRRVVTATVPATDAPRVKPGQRVRAFSPASRSRMYQGTVSQVRATPAGASLTVTLRGQTLETARHYVLEIVTEDGEFLTVPNEAIIETDGKHVVYLQEGDGSYTPREIEVGVQGELYTQIVDGLSAGEQVITIGSFFIDAEHKLKGS